MKNDNHVKHECTYYVPCFQKNDVYQGSDGELHVSSSFQYSMGDATQDLQMVASMNPDYILILKGEFDAQTQPFDIDVYKHNNLIKVQDKT